MSKEHERTGSKVVNKRLSIISDIILLIPIIIVTLLVINAIEIPEFSTSSEEVLSLQVQNEMIEAENEKLIDDIKDRYGINVLFGKSIEVFTRKIRSNSTI